MDYWLFKSLNLLAGRSLWLDSLIIFLSQYLICLMPMMAALIYFLTPQQQRIKYRRAIMVLILSLVIVEVIYLVIGLFYFRPRPFITHPTVNLLVETDRSQSFPSNHTLLAVTFSLAFLNPNFYLGLVFLLSALLIGLARIVAGVHYPFDVMMSIIIALFSTWLVTKIMRRYKQ